MKPVTKAVLAAAGFGTRFLPQTKAMPKEMLPIIDKPIIQYVVEELVAVGVQDIIIVTNSAKRSIEDHFDQPAADLIANLRQGGESKQHLVQEVKDIANLANFIYVRQKGPYGNGTPLLNVEHIIGDEPFFFTWSDDFIKATPLRFQQMIEVYKQYNAPVMSAVRCSDDADYDHYGFAGGDELQPGVILAKTIIEKPGRNQTPSDLKTVSGCLLTPQIFPYLHQAEEQRTEDRELYYNDALKLMIAAGDKVMVAEINDGKYYDAGNKLEYLKTVADFAISDEDVGPAFKAYLQEILRNH